MSALERQLRAAVAARLEADGWSEGEGWRGADTASFIRVIDGDFSATTDVSFGEPDRGSGVTVDNVWVGVIYEPLRRLWPLLGNRYRWSFVATEDDEEQSSSEDEDEDDDAWEPLCLVAGPGDVARAVSAVAGLIARRYPPFVARYADVDALLEAFEGGERATALLAATGRFAEALARLEREDHDPRFAHQVRRWIDSGGDPALIPAEPPPREPRERRSFGELYAARRRESRTRSEATEAVRRRGRGKSRDELRAMLVDELTQRGLDPDPLGLEMALDHLWDTKADQAKVTAQALGEIGRVGLGLVKAMRRRELPDLSPPDWLEPPDRACYELERGEGWVGVDLDADASQWLEKAHGALPKFFGVGLNCKAWLGPDGRTVHLGERRVGALSEAAALVYRPVLEAAQFREELPSVPARLARRSSEPRLVLELARPRA